MLTNMDVFCDLFLNRQTEKWNRIVLSKRRKELFNLLDQYIWNVNFSDFVNKGDLHWPLNDRWGWTLIVFLFVRFVFLFLFFNFSYRFLTVSRKILEKMFQKTFFDLGGRSLWSKLDFAKLEIHITAISKGTLDHSQCKLPDCAFLNDQESEIMFKRGTLIGASFLLQYQKNWRDNIANVDLFLKQWSVLLLLETEDSCWWSAVCFWDCWSVNKNC